MSTMRLGRIVLAVAFFESTAVLGVEAQKPVRLDAAPSLNEGVELPQEQQEAPRVRIPVQLIGYEKIVVTGKNGQARHQFKALSPLRHHLRARIERPNHFYVGTWHIETVPVQWKRETKAYEVKLRFFKRYGEGRELEELVGSGTAKGFLSGKGPHYLFAGRMQQTFKDPQGQPILAVGIGPEPTGNAGIAKGVGAKPPVAKIKGSREER